MCVCIYIYINECRLRRDALNTCCYYDNSSSSSMKIEMRV